MSLAASLMRLIVEWLVLPAIAIFLLVQVVIDHRTINTLLTESITDQLDTLLHNLSDDAEVKIQVSLVNTGVYRGILDRLSDTTYTVVSVNSIDPLPGRRVGDVLPLNNWSSHVSDFTLGKCICVQRDNAPTPDQQFFHGADDVTATIACPLMNQNYHLLGILSVNWYHQPPTEVDLTISLPLISRTAQRVVRYLELRG